MPNYFSQDVDPEKAIMHYCKPGTKTLVSYRVDPTSANCWRLKNNMLYRDSSPSTGLSLSKHEPSSLLTDEFSVSTVERVRPNRIPHSTKSLLKKLAIVGGYLNQKKTRLSSTATNRFISSVATATNKNVRQKITSLICEIKDGFQCLIRMWHWVKQRSVHSEIGIFLRLGGTQLVRLHQQSDQNDDTTTDKWSIVRANPKNARRGSPYFVRLSRGTD